MSKWFCGWYTDSAESEPRNNHYQGVSVKDKEWYEARNTVFFSTLVEAREFFSDCLNCDHIAEFKGTDFIQFHDVVEKNVEDKFYEKLELMIDSGEDADEIIDCVKEYIESTKEKAE